jgi:flagellar biogenesis protein FliO
VSKESPKDRLKVVIDLAYILLYEFKKLIHSFFPKVKKQKLIEVIIIGEFF